MLCLLCFSGVVCRVLCVVCPRWSVFSVSVLRASNASCRWLVEWLSSATYGLYKISLIHINPAYNPSSKISHFNTFQYISIQFGSWLFPLLQPAMPKAHRHGDPEAPAACQISCQKCRKYVEICQKYVKMASVHRNHSATQPFEIVSPDLPACQLLKSIRLFVTA